MGTTCLNLPELSEVGSYKEHSTDARDVEDDGLGEVVETPDEPEYARWTKVQHKRARSDSSLPNKKKSLTTEQGKLVDLAAERLTKEQQQKFQKWQNVRPRRNSSMSSRGEGPSRPKGKTIDPQERGNANLSQESLDVEAQAAAWDSLKRQPVSTKWMKEDLRKKKEEKVESSGKKKARHHKRHTLKNFTFSEHPAETNK